MYVSLHHTSKIVVCVQNSVNSKYNFVSVTRNETDVSDESMWLSGIASKRVTLQVDGWIHIFHSSMHNSG